MQKIKKVCHLCRLTYRTVLHRHEKNEYYCNTKYLQKI